MPYRGLWLSQSSEKLLHVFNIRYLQIANLFPVTKSLFSTSPRLGAPLDPKSWKKLFGGSDPLFWGHSGPPFFHWSEKKPMIPWALWVQLEDPLGGLLGVLGGSIDIWVKTWDLTLRGPLGLMFRKIRVRKRVKIDPLPGGGGLGGQCMGVTKHFYFNIKK